MVKSMYEPVPPLAESVDVELALLDRLLVTVEKLLEDAVTDLDKYVVAAMQDEHIAARARAEGLTLETDGLGRPLVLQDVREAFGLEERYWDLEGRFADILRKWLFVAVYSFVEEVLLTICRQEEREGNLPLSVEDFFDEHRGGCLLKRLEGYLETVAGLSGFPFSRHEWGEIYGHYRRLRNCIVHNDSKLPKDIKSKDTRVLKRYIRCKSSLRCLSSERIVFEKGFCEEVLQTTRSFFSQLFRALDEGRVA